MKATKAQNKDWRLFNQEKYLKGVTLQWKKWTPPKKTWDHDHCSFCWRTISDIKDKNIDNWGYTTLDNYHWICKKCFEDFKEMFQWKVKKG